jgi:hypothetical protein
MPVGPASEGSDVAEHGVAFSLDLLVVDRQLVDDVGVALEESLPFDPFGSEPGKRLLKFLHSRLELPRRRRVAADGLGLGLELLGIGIGATQRSSRWSERPAGWPPGRGGRCGRVWSCWSRMTRRRSSSRRSRWRRGPGAERVGGEFGEFDSLAAELVDVPIGAGDVLAAGLGVGEVWGPAGVGAGGLQAALGLGGVENAGHAFGG